MALIDDIRLRARAGLSGRLYPVADVAQLVDNSGGVAADGTIAAVTDATTSANAIKELATKVNEIATKLDSSGVTA